jgi:hypothetical protein
MMSELLSGFIGALIATVLSVIYLYLAEQAKLRTEIALEVVGYCDDIYDRLQLMHVHKDNIYTHTGLGMHPDEYRTTSHELSRLIKATKTHAKLEIVYGPGESVAALNELSHHFQETTGLLRSATEADWEEQGPQILELFKIRIEPLRKNLQRKLISGTKATAIANDLFARCKQRVK